MSKIVSVFGSSIPQQGDTEYENAYRLGKILGENGIDVCTGGYMGIMDAVSKGAVEAGRDAVGITVSVFRSNPSKHLTKNIATNSLMVRIEKLVEFGDAYIILPGGTGTMLELTIVWEFLNKGLMNIKPVAAVGDMWKNIIDEMEKRIVIEKRKTGLIKTFEDVEECAGYIIPKLLEKF
ncbi:MAG: LOG family protein [Melioribacteraceae bacterium]|nr:LOG family protein [Melioribacteraceae bacterium]MCF8354037.1 LOG family protein [Melioribacteraceae bacterium]MCF8392282.1 LOG family protein [Melioribacteraceae bacterium]MCF8417614.1 LOG family protein [Melioribacteraceae bacterium]